MTTYKKFTKDVGIIGITNLLTGLSGIILLPILTKTLGAYDYGVWVQILVTISLTAPFATLMLPGAMVRFLAGEKDKKEIQEGFFSTSILVLFTSVCVSVLLILLLELFAENLFGDGKDLIKIVALIIPIWSLDLVFLDFFRAFQQMKTYAVFTILQTYGEVALIAYFVLSGYGIFGAVLSLLIIRTILFLIMGYLIISKIGVKIPNFSRLREYMSFSLPTLPSALSAWVTSSSDRYVIGFFMGVAFVGFYSPGYAMGSIIGMYIGPLAFILFPVLSKMYDENKMNEVELHLKYSLKYFLMLAIPSAFGLSLLSKPVLTILSTPEIASQGYLITPFVAVSAVLFGVYVVFSQIITLVKKTKITGVIWIIAAILNLGLNIIVVPYMGILGAAITTLIAYMLAFVLTTYYSFKYFKFDIDFGFILKSILASIVMSLVIIEWNPVGALNILIAIGVCTVVYATVLLLLKGVEKEEIRFFKELFSA
jgi:O-antigen/teichoic acid export membrane protein